MKLPVRISSLIATGRFFIFCCLLQLFLNPFYDYMSEMIFSAGRVGGDPPKVIVRYFAQIQFEHRGIVEPRYERP